MYGRSAAAAPPTARPSPAQGRPRIRVTSLREAKRALRAEMAATRAAWNGDQAAAALALRDQFLALFVDAAPPSVAAGYWPIGDELDPRPLLDALCGRGWTCALPVVVARGEPLSFRRWRPGDRLVTAGFGLSEPHPDAPDAVPDIVIAPMLAADPAGRRLGYGGGFYDRTVGKLRAASTVTVVAIGYDVQIRGAVPASATDQRVDWVLSEARTVRCSTARQGR